MGLDLQERDRRYGIIREKMSAQGLDALVVMSSAQINEGGFVRYLTNYKNLLYNRIVIFPLSGEARLLVPSPVQKYWAGYLSWIQEIEEQIPSKEEALLRNLVNMGLSKGRLGFINTNIMPAQMYLSLVKNLPEASIVDATSIIEEARMVKSQWELAMVKESAALACLSFKVFDQLLKPGITEKNLIGQIDRELIGGGAEDIFHLFSAKPGTLFPFVPLNRKIENSDVVILNTELSGPGGYWVQMVRTAFVGKPTAAAESMYRVLIDITSRLASQLRPGKKVSEVADWVRNQIINSGHEIGVNFGHCLGLDVVERPIVNVKEETALEPGMVITVHPQLVSRDKGTSVWFADTYLITEGHAEVLTKLDPGP